MSRVRWRSGEFVTAQFHEDSASERVLAVQPAQIERNITSLWAFGCNLLGSVGALKNSVALRDSKRKLKRRSKTKKENHKSRHRTRFGNGRYLFAKGGTHTERLDFQMEGEHIPPHCALQPRPHLTPFPIFPSVSSDFFSNFACGAPSPAILLPLLHSWPMTRLLKPWLTGPRCKSTCVVSGQTMGVRSKKTVQYCPVTFVYPTF